MSTRAPYGTWRSPISAADLARSAVSLDDLQIIGGTPYWIESRPAEGGRYVIVTPAPADTPAPDGIIERTPPGFNARTRVHEYGGRPYTVARDGTIYFTHFADQRVYVQRQDAAPAPITPEGYRYADFALDPADSRVYCVREDHTAGGEPKNAIVALDVAPGQAPAAGARRAGAVLFADSDFVAYPRVSPDGRRLAWIAWNHPDMPWDATLLYVADITPQGLAQVTRIAGGPRESVLEPRWDVDGALYFVSDRSGWWNLYRLRSGGVETVLSIEADLAGPLWTLGESSYTLTGDGRVVLRYTAAGRDRLAILTLDPAAASSPGASSSASIGRTIAARSGSATMAAAREPADLALPPRLEVFDLPFVGLASIERLTASTIVAVATSPTSEPAIVAIDLASGAYRELRAPGALRVDPAYLSRAEPLEYPTAGGHTAHAFFYPPVNPDFAPLEGERPPLVVKAHGGPTSHSRPELNPSTQFWTTRGFAVLDVNYGGSSGYGRAYRERLEGNWGVVDVGDVVAGVQYLIDGGRVDRARTAVRGGSAGGFTVLAALAFHDVFRVAASYYGVSDLEALAHDTHKFESRYLDRLVAPLPQGKAIYEARAPIRHLEAFHAPLIVFQGAEDAVVPPSQSRALVAALERKGVPVVYLELEGEQHGFRKAESIVRTLEAELEFYGRVFGFSPPAP